MEEEVREVCKFLIVLVASCRAGKGVRVGDEAEVGVQGGAGGTVVVVVMVMMVVAEVGEGRLGAVRIPSTVRADKERKLRVEGSAGAGCDSGCRNVQVDGGVRVGSRGGCGCRSVSAVVLCVVVREREARRGLSDCGQSTSVVARGVMACLSEDE